MCFVFSEVVQKRVKGVKDFLSRAISTDLFWNNLKPFQESSSLARVQQMPTLQILQHPLMDLAVIPHSFAQIAVEVLQVRPLSQKLNQTNQSRSLLQFD